jgi:hypothetical protein
MNVDYKNTLKDIEEAAKKIIPTALIDIFSNMVQHAVVSARISVQREFNLATDWIPKNIHATPVTAQQRNAARKSLIARGDFMAAVYMYQHRTPEKDLTKIMKGHIEGETRKAASGGNIAEPGKDWTRKGYKTSTGRRRKNKDARALLEHFNASGSRYRNGTTYTAKFPNRKKRIGKGQLRKQHGKYFLIKGKGGVTMVAKRDPKKGIRETISNGKKVRRLGLSFAYGLDKSQRIDASWRFYEIVYRRALKAMSSGVRQANRQFMDRDMRTGPKVGK